MGWGFYLQVVGTPKHYMLQSEFLWWQVVGTQKPSLELPSILHTPSHPSDPFRSLHTLFTPSHPFAPFAHLYTLHTPLHLHTPSHPRNTINRDAMSFGLQGGNIYSQVFQMVHRVQMGEMGAKGCQGVRRLVQRERRVQRLVRRVWRVIRVQRGVKGGRGW